MNFDFTNYTFSAIITIFAAIVGMAYPFIQNTILKIDEKYKSEELTNSFLSEKVYHWFLYSFYVSIIFAILSPLLLLCFENAVFVTIWIYAHLLVTLWLIISTVRLYQLMQIYTVASNLREYLTQSNQSLEYNKNIRKIAEIARFSAYNNHQEMYLKCMSNVNRCIIDLADKNELNFAPSFYYSVSLQNESYLTKEIKAALAICTDIVNAPNVRDVYKNDASYINALLNKKIPLPQGIYDIVWRSVSEAVRADNKGWFKQYWLYSTQYITHLEFNINKELPDWRNILIDEKKRFIKFHIAIGGLLIHHSKTEWINEVLFYSLSVPYSYPLCPNTFNEWLEFWDYFEEFGDPIKFMCIQCFYPMSDIEEGVDQDSIILFFIEKYLGILFLRLWDIDGEKRLSNNILECISDKTFEKLEYWKNRFKRLKSVVERIYDDNLVTEISRVKVINDSTTIIDSYIQEIENEINKNVNNPQIDETKRKGLKDSINCMWDEIDVKFYDRRENDKFHVISSRRYLPVSIPASYLCHGYEEVDYKRFAEFIVDGFNTLVMPVFNYAFGKKRPPKMRYAVQYNDIGEALRRLKLSKEFIVLCNDFYIARYFSIIHCSEYKEVDGKHYFDDAEMIEYNTIATHPFLIILRKRDLPYLTFDKEEMDGLELINENKPLYSNLGKIGVSSLENVMFSVNVSVHFPEDIQYIRLELPYDIGQMDLKKIQHIESLI